LAFEVHKLGWSEPAATSAPVHDEAIQAVLGMNQKHILSLCPGIFQPLSLPQNFPLLPIQTPPPPPTYLLAPSYLLHLISRSFHLQTFRGLSSLSNTEL